MPLSRGSNASSRSRVWSTTRPSAILLVADMASRITPNASAAMSLEGTR